MKKATDNSMAASAKAVMEGLENSSALISMTQAEYDALSDEERTDNNMRAILDANPDVVDAKNVNFDNTDTNLTATNTQSAITELNGKLVMKVEQKTGEYKNQKLNKQVIICSVTLTPGLWLIIGFIDGNISSDFIYNNTLFDQTVRESMIGGGGSTNIILRGIGTTTTVNLSTYDFANVTSDLTYRGILTAICLKPYSDN